MILDKEYQTMYLREVDYLASHGVRYTFVKTIDNTRIYKYKKTPQLFKLLCLFYTEK